MKKMLLATVAVAALIAGPTLAQRQEAPAGDVKGAAPPPASIQKAPAEKIAPAGKVAPDRAADTKAPKSETTGQTTPSGRSSETDVKSRSGADIKSDKSDLKAKPDARSDTKSDSKSTTGQATPSGKPAAAEKADDKPGMKPGTSTQTRPGTSTETTRPGATTDTQVNTRASANTASLTPEQKAKIRTTVLTANAPRVSNVNFSINVGTVVPRTVRIVAVPATLVEIHPAWRGYMYFVHGDDIIIVEPRTLRIVAVNTA